MESSVIAISKGKLVIYHRDEKLPEEFHEVLRRYGVEIKPVFSSLCG